jgi:hypothetical protein
VPPLFLRARVPAAVDGFVCIWDFRSLNMTHGAVAGPVVKLQIDTQPTLKVRIALHVRATRHPWNLAVLETEMWVPSASSNSSSRATEKPLRRHRRHRCWLAGCVLLII